MICQENAFEKVISKMWSILFNPECANLSGTETKVFQEN